jgi:hypothetical protein
MKLGIHNFKIVEPKIELWVPQAENVWVHTNISWIHVDPT